MAESSSSDMRPASRQLNPESPGYKEDVITTTPRCFDIGKAVTVVRRTVELSSMLFYRDI
jgi:hypothetical protein